MWAQASSQTWHWHYVELLLDCPVFEVSCPLTLYPLTCSLAPSDDQTWTHVLWKERSMFSFYVHWLLNSKSSSCFKHKILNTLLFWKSPHPPKFLRHQTCVFTHWILQGLIISVGFYFWVGVLWKLHTLFLLQYASFPPYKNKSETDWLPSTFTPPCTKKMMENTGLNILPWLGNM